MFKNRSSSLFIAFVIAVLALLNIANVVLTQTSRADRSSPLDWYLNHSHPVLDGDSNIANPLQSESMEHQLAPLEWYFNHEHAVISGDDNALPMNTNAPFIIITGARTIDESATPCSVARESCDR